MLETALAKLLTLKAGATVLAVTATGGVALAAAGGALPTPLTGGTPKPAAAHATGRPADADRGRPSTAPAPKGSPSPSLVGLCRAYRAGAGDNPGKALENPAFSVLVTTAGDREKVAAYCDTLLVAQKADKGNAPTARPATKSTGRPETRPSAPESRPTTGADHRSTARPTR
ncbi:hypothetical protein [Micromonospora siamensis]|uniref:Uncharacterized protein n=1 Tax=Micromonospora siamensis TaxID=299152 RepID=A0A1C5JX76_9ACTN|nr:hypothetical protein [Micromonospora siamensis]SCG75184.1 hypothetical protein GA0074704_5134 [Micromonospora siamensis]